MPVNPISPRDIRDVAVAEDDFGHEMRIGKRLKMIADEFEHGGTYSDPVSNKPRQFDFRAKFRRNDKNIYLAVEAKNLNPDSPLVVWGTKRRKEESFYDVVNGHREDRISLAQRAPGNDVYPRDRFVGKSAFRVQWKDNVKKWLKVPDRDVYDCWAQALGSGVKLCEDACSESMYSPRLMVVLPVLVLSNHSLWSVGYDDDGNFVGEPETIQHCTYYVDHTVVASPYVSYTFSHAHFFTFDGFTSWMQRFVPPNRIVFDDWFDTVVPER